MTDVDMLVETILTVTLSFMSSTTLETPVVTTLCCTILDYC